MSKNTMTSAVQAIRSQLESLEAQFEVIQLELERQQKARDYYKQKKTGEAKSEERD